VRFGIANSLPRFRIGGDAISFRRRVADASLNGEPSPAAVLIRSSWALVSLKPSAFLLFALLIWLSAAWKGGLNCSVGLRDPGPGSVGRGKLKTPRFKKKNTTRNTPFPIGGWEERAPALAKIERARLGFAPRIYPTRPRLLKDDRYFNAPLDETPAPPRSQPTSRTDRSRFRRFCR